MTNEELQEKTVKCPYCEGKKTVMEPTPDSNGEPVEQECMRCKGEGRVPYLSTVGWSVGDDGQILVDGFRPRKVRPKGWMEKALASGEIRDPAAPDPDEGKDYTGHFVVQPPTATAEGAGWRG